MENSAMLMYRFLIGAKMCLHSFEVLFVYEND